MNENNEKSEGEISDDPDIKRKRLVSSVSISSEDPEKERSGKRRRKEKKSRKDKKHKKDKKKKDKKRKKRRLEYGTYGILTYHFLQIIERVADMHTKKQEFCQWLLELKNAVIDNLSHYEEKKHFDEFMEDYNTCTLPHKK